MEKFLFWIFMLSCAAVLDVSWSLPLPLGPRPSSQDLQHAEEYLRQFYNLRLTAGSRMKRHSQVMEDKIREMQRFFGLQESGSLDVQTLNLMKKDRCGVADAETFSLYLQRPRWRNHTITYQIAQFTTDLRREEVEESIHLAIKLWSDVTPLTFVRVSDSTADIVVSFTIKDHGDFSPFDGPGGALAHTFKPGEDVGVQVHFDDDELWTKGHSRSDTGYNLFTVAAHELGHSLGLSHSRNPTALMYPKYTHLDPDRYTLPLEDLLNIQALYGKKKELEKPGRQNQQ